MADEYGSPLPPPLAPVQAAGVSAAGAPVAMPGDASGIPLAVQMGAIQNRMGSMQPSLPPPQQQAAAPKKRSALRNILIGVLDSIALSQGFPTSRDYERRELQDSMAQQRLDIEQQNADTQAWYRGELQRQRVDAEQRKVPVPLGEGNPLVKLGGLPPDTQMSMDDQAEAMKEIVKVKVSGRDVLVVETINAQGRPVRKVVPKTEGAEYPMAPESSDESVQEKAIRIRQQQIVSPSSVSAEDKAFLQAHAETLRANKQAVNIINRGSQDNLSPQQMTKVQSLASQFDSNPVVKAYNEQVSSFNSIKSIIESGLGGPGDLAVVFQFMKGLDPTSVVRESEQEAAMASGNIFAGAYARFNGYFKPGGGKLPDQVKKDFLEIVRIRMGASQQQVKRMHQDFGRRIGLITGKPSGSDYLTDYSTLYGNSAGEAPAAPSGSKLKTFRPH